MKLIGTRIIVGLGNPGEKYKNNRHNVGYVLIDYLKTLPAQAGQNSRLDSAKRANLKGFILKKSDQFMNDSGSFVKRLASKYPNIPVSDLYIAHDDLDIKLGEFKIQFGKGPKVHNGIESVEEELGTKDFWRIRIGIENRHGEIAESISRGPVRGAKRSVTGKDYVLQDFSNEEQSILSKVLQKISDQINTFPTPSKEK